MELEILKIIEKHLPEQTAGVMKDYIEGAELTERALRDVQKELKTAADIIVEYERKDVDYHEAKDMLEAARDCMKANDKRKIELDEEARNMRCTIMEKELKMLTANMRNMESLVQKVFGHPNVSITRQVPVAAGFNNADGSYNSGDMLENASEKSTEGKE